MAFYLIILTLTLVELALFVMLLRFFRRLQKSELLLTELQANQNSILDKLALPIADIDAVRTDDADDGNCHIRVGSPTFSTSSRKLPALACRGESSDQDKEKTTGLVFFNVSGKDAKIIRDLLQTATPAQA